MKPPHRVFIDTNVLLTGAFNQRGPAGRLAALTPTHQFLHSAKVISEADCLIQRDAPSQAIRNAALGHIRSFLQTLKSECVADCPPPDGVSANDPGDDLILGAAIASKSHTICTYNLQDFPGDVLKPKTPLSIHRDAGSRDLGNYIQHINLSNCGTLLYYGQIHHSSSMGPILCSHDGTCVTADALGYVQLTGESVSRCSAIKPIFANEEFKLSIRYNTTDFEAALWKRDETGWTKDILSTGAGAFSNNTKPILFFVPNHKFSGHIQCISGLPRYVRDKKIISALDNYSLEAVAGSLDLKHFLSQLAVV